MSVVGKLLPGTLDDRFGKLTSLLTAADDAGGAAEAIGDGGVEGRAHRASKLLRPARVMATLPLKISSVH